MIIREAVLLSLVVSKLSHSIYDDLLLLVLSQTLRAVHNLIKQTFPKPEAPGSPATTRLCFQVLSLCLSLRSPRWEALLCAFLLCVHICIRICRHLHICNGTGKNRVQ